MKPWILITRPLELLVFLYKLFQRIKWGQSRCSFCRSSTLVLLYLFDASLLFNQMVEIIQLLHNFFNDASLCTSLLRTLLSFCIPTRFKSSRNVKVLFCHYKAVQFSFIRNCSTSPFYYAPSPLPITNHYSTEDSHTIRRGFT